MGSKTTPAIFNIASRELLNTERVWEAFVTGSEVDLRRIPVTVRDSWIRSRENGIDPFLTAAPFEHLPATVGELHQMAPWLTAAEPVFTLLQSLFNAPHHLLLLVDETGRILLSHGGSRALPRAQELHAIAGGKWAEDEVGCTALGATLHTGVPVQVGWSQTYCRNWHDWVNQAAPIHDPFTNRTMGALNVAGFREVSHPGTLNVLRQAISLIEMALLEQETRLRMKVLERFNSFAARYHSDGLLALDRHGYVIALNSAAEKELSLPHGKAVGQTVGQIRPLVDLLGPNLPALLDSRPNELVLDQAVIVPVTTDRFAGSVLIITSSGLRSATWRTKYSFADLVGEHPRFRESIDLALKASREDWPVLILGESGTGKELFAHAIHDAGPRRNGPFVVFTCAGIADELIGSELFGYVDGSFTGAARGGRVGKLALADEGTLFLDDVDCMPPKMQVSLLRVLEDQRVLPIGATSPISIDVRIIASSNSSDLEHACDEGRFRRDLYYRLNVLTISLSPLRDRSSDVPLLAKHILSQLAPGTTLSDDALAALAAHIWPGNIRELRNVLLRAVGRAQTRQVTLAELPNNLVTRVELDSENSRPETTIIQPLETIEREQIVKALRMSASATEAANQLAYISRPCTEKSRNTA
jgi:transcriptional regulator of acetoin/glycerol metabolism